MGQTSQCHHPSAVGFAHPVPCLRAACKIACLLAIEHYCPGWPEPGHWAGGAAAKAHQPQRGDMFIVRPNRNLRKPRRGGMVLSRTGHVDPTGLAEKIGGRGGHYKHVAPTELPLWRASGS